VRRWVLLVALLLLCLPTLSHAVPCSTLPACRKLSAAAQKHMAEKKPAEAQRAYEQALELSQDGALLRPLSLVLLAQNKTDEAFRLYHDHLAKLPSSSPEREVYGQELVELLNRPEMKAVPASDEPESRAAEAPQTPGPSLPGDRPLRIISPTLSLPDVPAQNRSGTAKGNPSDCVPIRHQKALRIVGGTLLGIGVGSIVSGGVLWSFNGNPAGAGCVFDGAGAPCVWNTVDAAVAAWTLGSVGVGVGSVLFGLSFVKQESSTCETK
jgi:hypothetical protein